MIIEKMRHIVMVVQQDFQNIRNAQKMLHILRDELQVPVERVGFVINRYEANHAITIKELEQALQLHTVGIIPSDFRSVNQATNLGVPLFEHAPKSPVAQAIEPLAAWVSGYALPKQPPRSLFKKLGAVLTKRG